MVSPVYIKEEPVGEHDLTIYHPIKLIAWVKEIKQNHIIFMKKNIFEYKYLVMKCIVAMVCRSVSQNSICLVIYGRNSRIGW